MPASAQFGPKTAEKRAGPSDRHDERGDEADERQGAGRAEIEPPQTPVLASVPVRGLREVRLGDRGTQVCHRQRDNPLA